MHASKIMGCTKGLKGHPHLGSSSLPTQRRHRVHGGSTSAGVANLKLAPTSTVGPSPPPPRTVSEAVRQARISLRLYREASAAHASNGNDAGQPAANGSSSSLYAASLSNGTTRDACSNSGVASTSSSAPESASNPECGSGSGSGPQRLIIELPLPSQRVGFLGRGAPTQVQADLMMMLDEGDYPGGEQQRFRVLRKLVDALLEGYDAEFLGVLEDDADGVGLWTCGKDMTLVANVTNATVPSLVKLFDGGYGSRVTCPGHTVVAVNPQWTDASSVGQPWQWRLRQRAAEVLEESIWTTLYSAKLLRSSRGANGLLHRAWPHRWELYPAATADARCLGDCVLASPSRPSSDLILARLNEAKPEMQKKAKDLGLEEPGWF